MERSNAAVWRRQLATSRGIQLSVAVIVVAGLLTLWLAGKGDADRLAEQLGCQVRWGLLWRRR
jgi:hypothetical protein